MLTAINPNGAATSVGYSFTGGLALTNGILNDYVGSTPTVIDSGVHTYVVQNSDSTVFSLHDGGSVWAITGSNKTQIDSDVKMQLLGPDDTFYALHVGGSLTSIPPGSSFSSQSVAAAVQTIAEDDLGDIYRLDNGGSLYVLPSGSSPTTPSSWLTDQPATEADADVRSIGVNGGGSSLDVMFTDGDDWQVVGSVWSNEVGPTFSLSALELSIAGATFTATLTVLDDHKEIATGYTGTVHFSLMSGMGTVPLDYTFMSADAGTHTFDVALDTVNTETQLVFDAAGTGERVALITPYESGAFATFNDGTTYFTPDGLFPAGGGNATNAYSGSAMPIAMAAVNGGVLTAFNNGNIYFSPNGQYLGGGGGQTQLVFDAGSTGETVKMMTPYKGGLLVTFDYGTTYFTPDGLNPAGGGSGVDVYSGSAIPVAMAEVNGGVLTAFNNGNIFFSPNGQDLGGGGQTQLVYDGTSTSPIVTMMTPYNGGVFVAFNDGQTFFTPNGMNPAGGGNAYSAYNGGVIPIAMTTYNGGVLTAFSSGTIFFSPDGQFLGGGGGQTTLVYNGNQHVVAMLSLNGGVLAAFDTGNIYFSPDAQNVGGGTNELVPTGGSGQTFTVTDVSTGMSAQATVTVYPAAAAFLNVAPQNSEGIFQQGTVAGTPIPFSVTATDIYGNVVTDDNDTLTLSSSDPTASLPTSVTLSNGKAFFDATFTQSGLPTITASDADPITGESSPVTVSALQANHLVITDLPASVAVGDSFTLSIVAEDKFDNTVPGMTDSVSISNYASFSGIASQYTFTPDDGGIITISGIIADATGEQTITVSDDLLPTPPASATIDVTEQQPTSLISVSGGGPFGGTATFTAKQMEDGSPLAGKSVAFTLNDGGNSIPLGSGITGNDGFATISGFSLNGLAAGTLSGAVEANFAGDATDGGTSGTGDLLVSPNAMLNISNLTVIYTGISKYVQVSTDPPGLPGVSVSYTQNATSVPKPTETGSYTFTATLNNSSYVATSVVGTLTIEPASSSFASLASPTILSGTPSTVLSGQIATGILIPPGSVMITLGGQTEEAAINPQTGDFSAAFSTAALGAGGSPYEVAYAYAGSSDFSSASGTSEVIVQGLNSPTVTTESAIGITATTATLNAIVNPNGGSTTTKFVYGKSPSLMSMTISTNPVSTGDGTNPVLVSAPLSGLAPGTTYYFEAVASNGGGSTIGAILIFTTSAATIARAAATTEAATAIGYTSATVNASVNPNGSTTAIIFVYGTSPTLMNNTLTTAPLPSGSGINAMPVSASLNGLQPGKTYYFEAVASNKGGTAVGAILSFTTNALPPPVTVESVATPTMRVTIGTGKKAKSKTETVIEVTFSGAVNGAANLAAYQLLSGKTKRGHTTYKTNLPILAPVSYNPATFTATLVPKSKLNLALPEQLTLNADFLNDSLGRPIDGGTNIVATLGKGVGAIAQRNVKTERIGPTAWAVDMLSVKNGLDLVGSRNQIRAHRRMH